MLKIALYLQVCKYRPLKVLWHWLQVVVQVPDDEQDCIGLLEKNCLAFYSGHVLTSTAVGSLLKLTIKIS